MPYPAPAPTRMIASRPTMTSFLIRFARVGLPKRKLASAAGCGGGAGFRPAIDLAFSSAFKIKLIWLQRSVLEMARPWRQPKSVSIADSLRLHEQPFCRGYL